jgi:diaminohydroxyphosphoribosylaminopyrimidine deaminase/5-amino-6-(5-phosphoribosylamino)uracil reductase
MVGCVVVHEDKIIGEGFTSPYGEAHAEVNAIDSVSDKELLKESTLYVSLEPCSHYGKTPPCADLIIRSGIPRVVIGIRDPHSAVDGKGIEKLKAAGIEVACPVLEKECREHHRRFLTFHEKKRPYIILKWAETADGLIAPDRQRREKKPEPYWISNHYSRQLVHKWRTEEQAILVGTNTVLEDNPRLNPRAWTGRAPLRVVLDRELKIPKAYHIYDQSAETLIGTERSPSFKKKAGTSFVKIDFTEDVVQQVCRILHEQKVLSVIVEGGEATLESFIEGGLWDEARIFQGSSVLGNGLSAPAIGGREISRTKIGTDTLIIRRND